MTGEDFDDAFGDAFAEPDGLDDLDVFGSSGGSEADARLAGDDGVRAGQDHRADVRRGAPPRATGDVPRRGRSHRHQHPPGGPGRHGDRQVPGLPRPGCAERQEGRHRHGDQGAAGPAGREGPPPGGRRPRAAGAARLRSAQGAEQLRLPPAGGRGGLGRDSGRAGRPGSRPGRRAGGGPGRGGASRRRRRGCAARGHRGGSAPAGGLVAEVTDRRPGRPELRALRPGLEHGQRGPAGVPGRLQLPLRRELLRRGRPRAGLGGRRRGGQHPPLRGAPGQRQCRPARARRGDLRRGPRARRGHDLEPRGGGDAGALPLAGHLRPLPRGAEGRRPARLLGVARRSARHVARATASGRACCTTTPVRRWTTANWPR